MLVAAALPSGAGAAGWSRPFVLAAPQASAVTPPQIAFSPSGQAAVGFAAQDEDNPASSQAFVALRSADGRLASPRRVPGAQEILGLGFAGAAVELLTGTAPRGEPCCSSVGVSALAGGAFGPRRALVSGLTGATVGSLTPLPSNRMLAAIGTDRGVWVAQSRPGGRFTGTHRVSAGGATPWTLAATAPGGAGTLAWTATTGRQGQTFPSQIVVASGSATRAPGGAHVAVTVAPGHEVDELGLIPGRGAGVTAAWVESWLDASGAYRSRVVVSDLGGGAIARAFELAGATASGLAVSGDGAGDQLLVWKSCDASPSCQVWTAFRRRSGRFGAPADLGAIDPYEDPAAAISPRGQALSGWVAAGRVLAAAPVRGRFTRPALVARGGDAGGLALAFGPAGQALAAWTDATATERVLGAVFGP